MYWKRIQGLTIKEVSEVYKFGLMIGLFRFENVLKWVDCQIASTDTPDLGLIEISFVSSKGVNEVISKLDDVKGDQDTHRPAKIILGLIYQDLMSGQNKLDSITYQLYSLSNILNECYLDEEILRELRIMDDYHYLYSVETIKNRIMDLLKDYDDIADQFNDQIRYESNNEF